MSRPLARLSSGLCNTNITYEYDSEREKRPLFNASQDEALKILGKEPLTPRLHNVVKGKTLMHKIKCPLIAECNESFKFLTGPLGQQYISN